MDTPKTTRMREFVSIVSAAALLAIMVPVASAEEMRQGTTGDGGGLGIQSISTGATALQIAQAMAVTPSQILGTTAFVSKPLGTPTGIGTSGTPLGGFPNHGTTYGMLSTGSILSADDPNSSGSTSADNGGGNVRGDTDFDVVVLRIDINVPAANSCLSFDFRFLSEEFPEWVGTQFNDAFIAELGASTWTTAGSTISAPNNFAKDEFGNVISINAAGAASIAAVKASGTTYDGGTSKLRASKVVPTAGASSLFLSIFDQGDHAWDSTVLLDRLNVAPPGSSCPASVVVVNAPPLAVATATPTTVNLGQSVTFSGAGSSDPDGFIAAWEWKIGGIVLSTAPSFSTSFATTGLKCATLKVTDNDGASATTSRCVTVVNTLNVDVVTDQSDYDVTQSAVATVTVRYVNLAPVLGASVAMTVTYTSGNPTVDGVLPASCKTWSATGLTNSMGQVSFTIPKGIAERCLGLLGVVELPTSLLGGSYSVSASASKDGNSGSDTTSYTVSLP